MTGRAAAGLAFTLVACAGTPAPAGGGRRPGPLAARACVTTGPERCFDARDDDCDGLIDDGCGLPTGLVQFVIAWETADADVDLRVTDPKGELVEVGRLSAAGLVKDRDCPGRRGECGGRNVENVVLEGNTPVRGRYRVEVRLERLGSDDPPVRVTLGVRLGPRTHAAEIDLARAEDERVLELDL